MAVSPSNFGTLLPYYLDNMKTNARQVQFKIVWTVILNQDNFLIIQWKPKKFFYFRKLFNITIFAIFDHFDMSNVILFPHFQIWSSKILNGCWFASSSLTKEKHNFFVFNFLYLRHGVINVLSKNFCIKRPNA